jgi:hypothetical protein
MFTRYGTFPKQPNPSQTYQQFQYGDDFK